MPSSINTNVSALTALQALQQTQAALAKTQEQVSTGYSVNSAADNTSYFSIATLLKADNGIINAANTQLSTSQAILSTANSAINSLLSTFNQISTALTSASNPGANITALNTQLAQNAQGLTDAVNGAAFAGLNILNGSQTSTLNFVAGFNATTTGGTFNTIAFSAQALTGVGGVSTTTVQPNITNATTIAQLNGLADNHLATLSPTVSIVDKTTDTTHNTFTLTTQSLSGVNTTTTYTGLDANGNVTTAATAVAFGVQVKTTSPTGLLTQNGIDLTSTTALQLATGGTNAGTLLTAVNAARAAVGAYASVIGATQSRIQAASDFNNALQTDYANGVSALIDADLNQASTRLQALQTQQQLGIQSLSIANQNSQLILKLFP